jgi:hypothetical protein
MHSSQLILVPARLILLGVTCLIMLRENVKVMKLMFNEGYAVA